MNKERFKKIKVVHYEGDQKGNQFALLKEDDYWYLKEQAERVGKLESIIETSTYIQRMLRKQKRCYREAIEHALHFIAPGSEVYQILSKPLEGEE